MLMGGRKYIAAFAALLRLFWIDAACVVAEDVSRAIAVRAGVFGGAVAGGVASKEGDVAGEGVCNAARAVLARRRSSFIFFARSSNLKIVVGLEGWSLSGDLYINMSIS